MLPCLSVNDGKDGLIRNFESFCQCAETVLTIPIGIDAANGSHVFFSQRRHSMSFTARMIAATLCLALAIVFQLRAEVEVVRSHTTWSVAPMEDVHSCRNWSDIQAIRQTMSTFVALNVSGINGTVAAGIHRSLPWPTAIGFENVTVESLFERLAMPLWNDWPVSENRRSISPLGNAVRDVLRDGPELEVIGPNATGSIAKVHHDEWAWVNAVLDQPRNSRGSLASAVELEMPVTAVIDGCRPKPTSGRTGSFIDLGPKAGDGFLRGNALNIAQN